MLTPLVTKEEIGEVICSMQNHKAPGNDGLPVEFYKTFWKELGTVFTKFIQTALQILT